MPIFNHFWISNLYFSTENKKSVHFFYAHNCVVFMDGLNVVAYEISLWDVNQSINMFLQAGELERVEQEISVSLHSVGVSLVNDLTQTEVAYLGITR